MEPSNLKKLLRAWDSDNSANMLQKSIAEMPMSEEQKQQHQKDIKIIETEIGVAETSLNKIALDWSHIPQVLRRAKAVVGDISATEARTSRHVSEFPISAERTAAFVSGLKSRSNIVDKLFNARELVYDNTAEINPILEEATRLKNEIIAQVVKATTEFDVQGLVSHITKVLEARRELSNRLLEREASFSLYDDASRNLVLVKEEHGRVLEEHSLVSASLKAKREEEDAAAQEAKLLQEQIEVYRMEIPKARLAATTKRNQYESQMDLIKQRSAALLELRNTNAAKRSKLAEMKDQIEKLQALHAQNKVAKTTKAAQEMAAIHRERDAAVKHRDEVTRLLQVTQDEFQRIERVHEQISYKEAGADDLTDKVHALQKSIQAVVQEHQAYKQKFGATEAAKKAEIAALASLVNEKRKTLGTDQQNIAALFKSIASKKLEIEQEECPVTDLDFYQSPDKNLELRPIFTSTPLSAKEKNARKQAKSPAKTKKKTTKRKRW